MRGETGGILEEAIKETAEMATELLSLRAQLATSIKRESAARKGFDEQLERANAAEAQLAELRGQEPAAYQINIDGKFIFRGKASLPIYESTGRDITPLYIRPVPPAVSKPVRPIGVIEAKAQGTDTYTLKCFYRPEGTSNLVGQNVYAAPPASQPYTVPDGWKMVPNYLTPEMRAAWDSAPFTEDDDEDMRNAYRFMIAAAPQHKGE
ncbi:hypothetical protein KU75_16075 [Pectobacterium odoriferum]|uniref:Uncharacterized protein n=2 Tax=Pectobacterium odoriferum TaxID=78398 RepID=A0ABR4VN93_9GAMM|nr:hypothetical protein KU75_16075 [Pectobacterium odoriferum]